MVGFDTMKFRVFAVLALILLSFFSFKLGNRPLATPDEGRYVEIPREMVVSGDWLTPRLNGVKYFEKPPLFYWCEAVAIKIFGAQQEWAMRLIVVLFAAIGCLATYLVGQRYYGERVGFLSAIILSTSILYFCLSRLIILDMAVSVLVTLGFYSFYTALQHPTTSKYRRIWYYAFYACCALGVLTKGIMTLAILGPAIVLWAISTKHWQNLWPAYLPTGILLFLTIAAPWHILVSLKNPEFAHKYFIVEHFLRYTSTVHLRYQPAWFFIPILLVGFLPWTSLLPQSICNAYKDNSNTLNRFLLIWSGWVLLFFSLSNSKLIPYILPAFPPLSLLIANYVVHMKEVKKQAIGFSSLCLILAMVGIFSEYFFPELTAEKAALKPYIYTLCVVFLGCGGLAYFSARHLLSIMTVAGVSTAIVLCLASPFMQRPSLKPLIDIINTYRYPEDKVISLMSYYQDLPVYTNQIVTVVEARGELEFGTTVEDTSKWMISEKEFLKLWKQKKQGKLWVIGRQSEIEAFTKRHAGFKYKTISHDSGNLLITR